MNNFEFAEKLKRIAGDYKTTYVMGCFGAPLTSSNIGRYIDAYSYNRDRKAALAAKADKGYFGFDCVCLIKAVMWGWCGDSTKSYGGAVYASGGVGDIGDHQMISMCPERKGDFSDIQVGEAVWMPGHIGVYVGDGLCVECTAAWEAKVMLTALGNIGEKKGYHTRSWTCHGKLPFIEYTDSALVRCISGVNIPRYTDRLVVYTKSGTTGTNRWGSEAVVNCYGKVTNYPAYGACNNKVTSGFVLSGHGVSSKWILANIHRGDRVYRDGNIVRVGKACDGKRGYIAGRNTIRLENEIVIYSGTSKSGTNRWGAEVQVSADGVVMCDAVYGKCDLSVPTGGCVISGHGKGADWIINNLKKGKRVTVTADEVK